MTLKNANQLLVFNSNWYNKFINYDTRRKTRNPGKAFFSGNDAVFCNLMNCGPL